MSDALADHDLNDLFRSIGEVTVAWAYLENGIDLWVDVIWKHWEGGAIGMERPRTSLGRKLDFIRAWHKRDERWQALFPGLPEHVDKVERLSDHRHLLMHGIVADLDTFPTTGLTTVRMVTRKRGHAIQTTGSYSIEQLTALRTDIFRAAVLIGATVECFDLESTDHERDDSLGRLLTKLR